MPAVYQRTSSLVRRPRAKLTGMAHRDHDGSVPPRRELALTLNLDPRVARDVIIPQITYLIVPCVSTVDEHNHLRTFNAYGCRMSKARRWSDRISGMWLWLFPGVKRDVVFPEVVHVILCAEAWIVGRYAGRVDSHKVSRGDFASVLRAHHQHPPCPAARLWWPGIFWPQST